MADVETGVGPFLAIYLAAAGIAGFVFIRVDSWLKS